jgi:hypothetical protein
VSTDSTTTPEDEPQFYPLVWGFAGTETWEALNNGAEGDGVADDTDALQNLLDYAGKTPKTAVIQIAAGTYRITRPLVYNGSYGYGIRLVGECVGSGPTGAVIKYDGPPGEAVININGGTNCTIEWLAIDCNQKARAGVSIMPRSEGGTLYGVSGVWLRHLQIIGGVGPNSSCVVAGVDAQGNRDIRQCDHIILDSCSLSGADTKRTTQYGFLTGWANCKNFAVRDCCVAWCQTGIYFGGSGHMIVDGFDGGGNGVDFVATTGMMDIRAGNSEQSDQLLTGGTGANAGTVSIANFSWASATAKTFIVEYEGFLYLNGNQFWNMSQPGATPNIRPIFNPGSPAGVVSMGNHYVNMTGYAPFHDSKGKVILQDDRIMSVCDYGGPSGNLQMLKRT